MNFFSQYFQSFSMFIYNGSLLKKFSQFFKIYKSFYKKREKMIIQLSMRKEKLRKTGLCFITGYLIRPFNMTVIHFFFNWSFCSRDFFLNFASLFATQFLLFDIRMTLKLSKGGTGNAKQLGITNYNIYFKNNFNRLVMNVTQTNFLYRQNVHI